MTHDFLPEPHVPHLLIDQHGHIAIIRDTRNVNGQIYADIRMYGGKIYQVTDEESRNGFALQESSRNVLSKPPARRITPCDEQK
jgi:hypothetical protein